MTDQKTAMPMPSGMPSLDEVLLQSNDMPWRAKSLPGVSEKMLWRDEQGGSSIALIKFDKGASIPQPHLHASNQFMFCLKGKYEYTKTGVTLTAGSFYWNPKGNVHGPTLAHEETIVVEIYDGPHYPQRPAPRRLRSMRNGSRRRSPIFSGPWGSPPKTRGWWRMIWLPPTLRVLRPTG